MAIHGVISDSRVPVKFWTPLPEVDEQAIVQLRNTANLPFVFKHVAVMADVHHGKGSSVGTVIATKGAIVPACVGVDLGCGMMAVMTPLDANLVIEKIKYTRARLEEMIPVGHLGNKVIEKSVENCSVWNFTDTLSFMDKDLRQRAMSQLGSLGGGNHFIEICIDTGNRVWVMLHSGSRNVGKTLAERHINEAWSQMQKYFIQLADKDLSYLVEGTEEFNSYIQDLMWCQEYAMYNRMEMMNRVLGALSFIHGTAGPIKRLIEVNCHHNYVERENHYGKNVFVTRKGAVRARAGDFGIIPGSMGTRSYIVRGLGNEESFQSCSHGAGRRMSRAKARAKFSLSDVEIQTAGVECKKDDSIIDELPQAYKDIDAVMANQSDLVEIIATLKQIMCIKG